MRTRWRRTPGSIRSYSKRQASVFLDENAVEFFDPDHSEDEDRFLSVREHGKEIRLISVRKATKNEAKAYPWTKL